MNVSMLLFSTQVNNSLYRDGMDAIASAFNIFFNLVCLVFSGRSFGEGGVLWISIFASIMNLVILIMSTMYHAELLKCLVKDINENRLSKFEIALGIVKMIEDLVEDDVQYNFVQHFSGPEPMFSENELRQPDVSKRLDESVEARRSDALHQWLVKSGFGCSCSAADDDVVDQHQFYPAMPDDLVKKFGDDGLNPSWFAANGSNGMPPAPAGSSHPAGNGVSNGYVGRLPSPRQLQPPIPPPRRNPPVVAQNVATSVHTDDKERNVASFVFPDFPPPQNGAHGSMSFPIFPTETGPVSVMRQPEFVTSMQKPEPLKWTNGDISQC